MAAPHVEEESTSISMVVENWAVDQVEQFSPIQRSGGYPWRLRTVKAKQGTRNLYVICEKSSEAELWHCNATFASPNADIRSVTMFTTHMFTSWDKNSQKRYLGSIPSVNVYTLKIKITIEEEGNSWRIHPTLGPFDRILICGDDKKIPVNTVSLASQSFFFDRLFNGDFKEKNMDEIFIGDVEYEDFFNMIEMGHGSNRPSLTDDNVHNILQMVPRFDLKIVEDRVVFYLLSSSSFSIHKKLLISEQFNLPFLKVFLLKSYTNAHVIGLINSTEFDQLSHDSLQYLLNKGHIDFNFAVSSPSPMNQHNCFYEYRILHNVPNDSNTIIMKVAFGQEEQFSSVYRINGFPWRLRVERRGCFGNYRVYVICDKWREAELWKCTATITINGGTCAPTLFASWDEKSHEQIIYADRNYELQFLEVKIATDDDGESYCRRTSLNYLDPRDGILVFENTEKKIEVNKKSLASQSPFFDRLFFGNFNEKDVKEIPIGDADYEEFSNIMTLLYEHERFYEYDDTSLNCNNAERMLELAEKFELRILEVRVVSFLLSPSSSNFSRSKKLLIADKYNLPFLKEGLISQINSINKLKELYKSPEWNQLSKETLRILFKTLCT